MTTLASTTVNFRANTAQFNREMSRARRQLRQFSQQAQRARRSLTGFGTAIVAGLGINSFIRTIADFEKSIAGVAAVTRATAQEMVLLTDTARELGATTEFSATQAADGLKFLGQAGFNATQAIAASADVLDLATAGTLGLAEAADIASNVMSGYGIAAENAGRVTDVLAAIASRANTNVLQIGEAFAQVSNVASKTGVSLETTAAALGVLGDNAIQGSAAGTGLKNTLARLVNPSTAAANALERMGIAMEDINPETNNFVGIMQRLADANLSASDAFTIFGKIAAPSVLALTSQVGRLRELEEAMIGAGGEAARMAAIMRDNLSGDIDTLGSSIQDLVLSLGDGGLTSVLRTAVQALTTAVRGLAENAERLVAYLGAGLVAVLVRSAGQFAILTGAILASGRALLILRGALIRTGIGLLVVGLGEGIFRVTQAVGGFAEAFRFAVAIASEALERVSLEVRGLNALFFSLTNFIGYSFNRAAYGIVLAFDTAWEQVVAIAQGGVAAVTNLFTQIGDAALFAFRQPLEAIRRLFDGVINIIRERINSLIRAVNSVAEFAGLGASFSEIPLSVTISPQVEAEALEAGETVGEAFSRGYRESIDSLRSERDPVLEYLNDLGDNLATQAQDYRGLADSLFELARAPFQSIQELRDHIKQLGEDTQATADTIDNLGTNVQANFEEIAASAEVLPEVTAQVERLGEAQVELNRVQEFSDRAAKSFTDSLRGVILGTQSGSDAVKGFIVSLADLVLQYTVLIPLAQSLSAAISGAFGGGGLFGGAFATGGFGRGLALVGERGPELVDLGAGSRVYSNDQLAGMIGGGAPVVNNSFNIQSSDGPGVRAAIAQSLPSIVDASVNTMLQDSNRPGPVRRSLRGY